MGNATQTTTLTPIAHFPHLAWLKHKLLHTNWQQKTSRMFSAVRLFARSLQQIGSLLERTCHHSMYGQTCARVLPEHIAAHRVPTFRPSSHVRFLLTLLPTVKAGFDLTHFADKN